ncbi:MAG: hypothetical protein QGD88_02910 [Anaerolineae bacterium]|nr:hypothetical protein [Anaerolineae bacterium]MDK1080405.1 hypothetical protein [Anaerolineae bacterium]
MTALLFDIKNALVALLISTATIFFSGIIVVGELVELKIGLPQTNPPAVGLLHGFVLAS